MLNIVACVLIVASPTLGAEPGTELEGTWRLASVEGNGKALPLTAGHPRWAIRGDKVHYGGEDLATLTADAGSTPKTVDMRFVSPSREFEGIYAIEGDTLKVCLNTQADGVKERPLVFSTKGKESWRLLVFKRDTGEEADDLRGFVGMALNLRADTGELVIGGILDDSPAKKAGLQMGDVLLEIAGSAVKELRPAIEAIRRVKPGSNLTLHIRRDGKEQDIAVRVGVLPFDLVLALQ
jgi:uncharacterized protein (TIGR03067 family)